MWPSLEGLAAILPPKEKNMPKNGADRMDSRDERWGKDTRALRPVVEPRFHAGLKSVFPCRFHNYKRQYHVRRKYWTAWLQTSALLHTG